MLLNDIYAFIFSLTHAILKQIWSDPSMLGWHTRGCDSSATQVNLMPTIMGNDTYEMNA